MIPEIIRFDLEFRKLNMPIPFFIAFLWFCIWLGIRLRQNRRTNEKNIQSFWDKEREANFTRAKPIDDLPFITVPIDTLPFATPTGDAAAEDAKERIRTLASERIINLTGITNTDLKLRYGAANLPLLTACDQNFTALVTALHKWGRSLIAAGDAENDPQKARSFYQDAQAVLSFAVTAGSDISDSYRLLAALATTQLSLPYEEQVAVLRSLKEQAAQLDSLTKPQLIADLSSILQQIEGTDKA